MMEEVCEEYFRDLDQQLDQRPIVDINQKMIHCYDVTLVEGQDIYPQPLLSLRPAYNIRLRMNRCYS